MVENHARVNRQWDIIFSKYSPGSIEFRKTYRGGRNKKLVIGIPKGQGEIRVVYTEPNSSFQHADLVPYACPSFGPYDCVKALLTTEESPLNRSGKDLRVFVVSSKTDWDILNGQSLYTDPKLIPQEIFDAVCEKLGADKWRIENNH